MASVEFIGGMLAILTPMVFPWIVFQIIILEGLSSNLKEHTLITMLICSTVVSGYWAIGALLMDPSDLFTKLDVPLLDEGSLILFCILFMVMLVSKKSIPSSQWYRVLLIVLALIVFPIKLIFSSFSGLGSILSVSLVHGSLASNYSSHLVIYALGIAIPLFVVLVLSHLLYKRVHGHRTWKILQFATTSILCLSAIFRLIARTS